MPIEDHYDIVIIGSGAGGGTLAHHLAPTGKRILILERGDYLTRELANWDPTAVFVENRYVSKDTWHDKDGKAFQPQVHYVVGGATKMYGAALFRLRETDFGEIQHHDGISPAWPIEYSELEPYYCKAERLFQVHGQRGEDPFEPPASEPYPYPAISHEPRIARLAERLTSKGLHPFHAPCGVMLDEVYRARSACIRCSTCDGYPCMVHAKADSETLCIRPAIEYDNVTLMVNTPVTRLETSPDGKTVTAVHIEHEGKPSVVSGDIVVVSAGAANSARILLLSANDKHPDGLANGSGMVGRHFMFHNSTAMVALSLEPNPTQFQKTLSINDFYSATKDYEFPMGNIQMIGKSKGPMFKGDAPKFAPGFTLDQMAEHAVDFWLSTEDLPDPNNRVSLNKNGNIILDYTFNNQDPTKMLLKTLESMLSHLECHPFWIPNKVYFAKEIPIAGVGHQSGTCRFGTDSKSSVLDTNCKAHELDNLYVVDTSFFPSIGAVNPSLTAIANAIRVGDHLVERMG